METKDIEKSLFLFLNGSLECTTLELFVQEFYSKIVDINWLKKLRGLKELK